MGPAPRRPRTQRSRRAQLPPCEGGACACWGARGHQAWLQFQQGCCWHVHGRLGHIRNLLALGRLGFGVEGCAARGGPGADPMLAPLQSCAREQVAGAPSSPKTLNPSSPKPQTPSVRARAARTPRTSAGCEPRACQGPTCGTLSAHLRRPNPKPSARAHLQAPRILRAHVRKTAVLRVDQRHAACRHLHLGFRRSGLVCAARRRARARGIEEGAGRAAHR